MISDPWDMTKTHTRIKLCEFESLDAAYEASFIGAEFLGFHLFDDQPYWAKRDKFAEIFGYLPPMVHKTLLTDIAVPTLLQILTTLPVDALQLYQDCTREEIASIRESCGAEVKLLKVMSEKSDENFIPDDDDFIAYYDDIVDAFLLDSFFVGGTGEIGDWDHCAEIVRKATSPVFLAGGLSADNILEAIQIVRPFGVDIENGVSDRLPDGRRVKNMLKCRLFVEKVREADWKQG